MQAVVVPEAAEETLAQLLPRADRHVLQVHQPRDGWAFDRHGDVPPRPKDYLRGLIARPVMQAD